MGLEPAHYLKRIIMVRAMVNRIPLVIGVMSIIMAVYFIIIAPLPFNMLSVVFGYFGFILLSAGISPSIGDET